MRTHVKVLGILALIYGSGKLLEALLIGVGSTMAGSMFGSPGDENAQLGAVAQLLGTAFAGIVGIFGGLMAISGVGLLTLRPWARILSIVSCALALIHIPFGTILGIYGLWVLFNKETQTLFSGAPAA